MMNQVLSSAYQETAFKVQNQDKNIEILDKDISMMQTEIKNYESRISQKDSRLAQLTTIRTNLQSTQDVLIEKYRSTTAVRKQITDIDSEIKRMDSEISSMNDSISSKNVKIGEIERNKLGVESNSDLAKEVGPLKYIANLTDKSLDQVVNWYIIVLMLVFDPLAIALVIAANFAFQKSKDEDKDQPNDIKEDKEKKEIKMKKIWNKMKNMLNIFKRKKTITQEQIINDPIEHEELIIENIIEEEKILDIEIPTEEVKINEAVIENPIEPNIILEENKEEVGNKVEEKDKYKDSNLSIEKQKMIRERFRNKPGSDPLKLR